MTTRRMTAEEWASVYGEDVGAAGGRFWLVLLVTLIVGLLLGAYAIPRGALPGIATHPAEAGQAGDMVALSVLEPEHQRARLAFLEAALAEAVEAANVESDVTLEVRYVTPARSTRCILQIQVSAGTFSWSRMATKCIITRFHFHHMHAERLHT